MTKSNSSSARSRRRRSKSSISHSQEHNDFPLPLFAASILIFVVLLWDYWPTILPLFKDWQRDQNYSVGQLVPLAALYLLWHDRDKLSQYKISPCWWGGITLLVLAQAARGYGLLYLFESAERYSLVLTIAGVVLLLAGWQIFYKLRWILLFLFLMVPFPGRLHNLISGPLQTQATASAVFALELLGVSVAREGNVILLNSQVHLAVAEACSGLRMLTAFIVVASVLAYVINRPGWQKVILVISSVPIAIICNLIRLVVTAELYLLTSSQVAERFFHDFAGLTMMPLAILIMVGELMLMHKLIIPDPVAVESSNRAKNKVR